MSRPQGSARADAAWLTAGTALSALAIYVFLGLGTRAVGAAGFAPVSVLWSLWAVSAAALTFPVQHWIIQTIAAAGREDPVWDTLPRVWAAAAVVGVVTLGVTWVWAEPLFGIGGAAFPVMSALLPAASVAMGVNRGVMSARGRFRGTAAAILGENLIRVAVAVVAGSRLGSVGYGWTLVAGFLVAAAFPMSFRPRRTGDDGERASIALLGGFTGANVASQTVLTIGPVLLSVLGGAPVEVTALFSVLALLRAPYTVALGASVRITEPLTRLAGADRGLLSTRTRQFVIATTTLAVVAGALSVAIVPAVVRVVFDVPDSLSSWSIALLTVGSVVALGNLIQMLTLLAMERAGALMRAWALAILIGAMALLMPGDAGMRVAIGFAAAEATALFAMAWATLATTDRRPSLIGEST